MSTIGAYLTGQLGHSVTRASDEQIAAIDAEADALEIASADTERPLARDWRELVRAAADALPNRSPFRACALSLRNVLVDHEHAAKLLGETLHWLSGSLETLDAYGLVADLGAVESAYDFTETALDALERNV